MSQPSERIKRIVEALEKALRLPDTAIMTEEQSSSHQHGTRAAARYRLILDEDLRFIRSALTEARLLAAELEGDGWLPIESAPKDGRGLLGWLTWRDYGGFEQSGADVIHWTDHNGGGWVSYRLGRPTHWRPLSPAPSRLDQEETKI